MKKKEILSPESRYKKAPSEELNLIVNLEEEKTLLTNDDRDVILDLNELFDEERNQSKQYKVHGKIKMIFRNLYTGSTTYDYLRSKLYLNGFGYSGEEFKGFLPYDEFAFIRENITRKKPLIYSGSSLIGFDGYDLQDIIDDEHRVITEITSSKYNWNIFLSYVYDKDDNFPMTYTLSDGETIDFISSDGIPFEITDDDNSYVLTSPIEHGMNEGEFIILEGNPYYISSVGNENYNSEKYIINIIKSQIPSTVTTFDNRLITGKRCIDNSDTGRTTSTYYVHKIKTLTSVDDCIIDKIGFESSIWENERKLLYQNSRSEANVLVTRNKMESILYDFKDPFILTGLTNNLGYTPTDVYVSIIFRNGNGYFEYPPKVGYKFNFHDTWIDEYFDGTGVPESSLTYDTFTKLDVSGNTLTFKYGEDLPVGSTLSGCFVEYIPTLMTERIISYPYHKITSVEDIFNHGQFDDSLYSGASLTNPYGIFYQSQYKVELRTLSPYVETSRNPNIDNLPDNAKYIEEDKYWKWRDLYSHGYIDDLGYGVNHPFLNNIHYVKNDINFYLRNEKSHTNKSDGVDDFDNRILLC